VSEHVREVYERDFEQAVLKSRTPVLVDFWAQWCGPCRMPAPVVEATAEQYGSALRVFKLNVDDSPIVVQRYGIKGIPTLILFKDGVERERIVSVVRQEEISETVNRYIRAALAKNNVEFSSP